MRARKKIDQHFWRHGTRVLWWWWCYELYTVEKQSHDLSCLPWPFLQRGLSPGSPYLESIESGSLEMRSNEKGVETRCEGGAWGREPSLQAPLPSACLTFPIFHCVKLVPKRSHFKFYSQSMREISSFLRYSNWSNEAVNYIDVELENRPVCLISEPLSFLLCCPYQAQRRVWFLTRFGDSIRHKNKAISLFIPRSPVCPW